MQAVPATEASPRMMLLEEIDPLALKALTMAAEEDVEVIATLTDIAEELEGKQSPIFRICGYSNHFPVILRSKPAMVGVQTKEAPNSLMNRPARLSLMPNKRKL
jgi:hypothetical protein